jgi:hypothetical protein
MREQRKLKKLKSLIRRLRTRPAFNLQKSTHKSLDDKIEQKRSQDKNRSKVLRRAVPTGAGAKDQNVTSN